MDSRDAIDRAAERELLDAVDPVGSASSVDPSGIAQTADRGNYPTSSPAVFALNVVSATADETEGAVVNTTIDTATTFYALNLSNIVPPIGTMVSYISIGDRHYFEYYGPPKDGT